MGKRNIGIISCLILIMMVSTSILNGMEFKYDAFNRLVDVNPNTPHWIKYLYDHKHRRVAKVDGNTGETLRIYIYAGWRMIAIYDGSGSLLFEFVDGVQHIDEHLMMINYKDNPEGDKYYYILSHNMSVDKIVDENGQVVETYEYTAYGETTVKDANGDVIEWSQIGNPYGFHGRFYDTETHFYYFRYRYYCPEMKRFISMDPMGFAGGSMNLYETFGCDPINCMDPYGLYWKYIVTVQRDPSGAIGEPVFKRIWVPDKYSATALSIIAPWGQKCTLSDEDVKTILTNRVIQRLKSDPLLSEAWEGQAFLDYNAVQSYVAKQYAEYVKGINTDAGKIFTTYTIEGVEVTREQFLQVVTMINAKFDRIGKGNAVLQAFALAGSTAKPVADISEQSLALGVNMVLPGSLDLIEAGLIVADPNSSVQDLRKAQRLSENAAKAAIVAVLLHQAGKWFTAGDEASGVIRNAKSLIKKDPSLVRAAQKLGRNPRLQREADDLVRLFIRGHKNPGIGTKNLMRDIFYLRGRGGARVFYRIKAGSLEILAKASKADEQKVINVLRRLYP